MITDITTLKRALSLFLVTALVTAGSLPAAAQDEEEFEPRAGSPPAKRTGGASRGEEDLFVSVLAPRTVVGLTSKTQPVLYWYLSKDTKHPIEIVVNDRETEESVLAKPVTLPGGTRGIQKLDLSKLPGGGSATLKPGREYEWVVEVVIGKGDDAKGRSAACRFKVAADVAADKLPAADAAPAARAAAYAREGIWFDYLAALREQVEGAAAAADPATSAKLKRFLARQGLILNEQGDIDEPPLASR